MFILYVYSCGGLDFRCFNKLECRQAEGGDRKVSTGYHASYEGDLEEEGGLEMCQVYVMKACIKDRQPPACYAFKTFARRTKHQRSQSSFMQNVCQVHMGLTLSIGFSLHRNSLRLLPASVDAESSSTLYTLQLSPMPTQDAPSGSSSPTTSLLLSQRVRQIPARRMCQGSFQTSTES